MSKKRRVFDIDFDDETQAVPAGTAKPEEETRRGPMAAAITETADATRARQDAEAAIRSENDALAHEHVRLKRAGLITDLVALDLIDATKLTRDRVQGRDEDLDELKTSIREVGLSNPIRVEKVGERFELIQGYRRLSAYRELLAETGDEAFAAIPAGINATGEDLRKLYRRMVDENLVRRDVSFGELAALALAYRAEDPNLESYDQAVETLFASSARQKRSYIKSFVRLLAMLQPHLVHIEAVSRAMGLELVKRLDVRPERLENLRSRLKALPDHSVLNEQALLQAFLSEKVSEAAQSQTRETAKTTFKMARPEGTAKCMVSDGRLEIRLDRDFTDVERTRLEAAFRAFFDRLDRQ